MSYWYDELEKAEQEKDAREYEMSLAYKEGYQQGIQDAIEELKLHDMLQDIVYAQSMINRTVYRLNCLMEQLEEKKNEDICNN